VSAVMPVLEDIGALPTMEAAGFSVKEGACWTVPALSSGKRRGTDGAVQAFRGITTRFNERMVDGLTYTWHVDRATFDQLMFNHAGQQGAIVLERVRATEPMFDADGVTVTARAGGSGGLSWPVRARMFVDATGRSTLLGSKLKRKVHDPVFDQYAVYTRLEGLDRGALTPSRGESEYIAIHFLPRPSTTWVWQIPITDTVTSIGVVAQKAAFREHGGSNEDFFWSQVGLRPELEETFRAAKVVEKFRTEGDYSYSMQQVCGDRHVQIGDAARFVDPIFSSGVSIALNSARFAAADIIAAHASGDFSKQAFSEFETRTRCGMNNWYRFISAYYTLGIFYAELAQDPQHRYGLIKLLQGDLYDEEDPAILRYWEELIREVNGNPDHLWHKDLGTLAVPSAKPVF
jgi:1H-pyrrole-2-carbonyl-[peptidyl-carrier protein] chlorinase